MTRTKFCGSRSIGSGDDFQRLVYHIQACGPWSCDPGAASKLSSPLPLEFPKKTALIGLIVSEEKIFEIVDGRRIMGTL